MSVRAKVAICWLVLGALSAGAARPAVAAPWDQDMSKQQSYKANEMARAPVAGTVPLGHLPFPYTNNDEAGEKLSNPVQPDADSLARGRRLWSVNCVTCHGVTGAGDGPVAQYLTVPDLHQDFYKARTDGRIFAVIYNGQNQMPRYGYKFSASHTWDIVNYVRHLQSATAAAEAN